jgi:hypothetical protein
MFQFFFSFGFLLERMEMFQEAQKNKLPELQLFMYIFSH